MQTHIDETMRPFRCSNMCNVYALRKLESIDLKCKTSNPSKCVCFALISIYLRLPQMQQYYPLPISMLLFDLVAQNCLPCHSFPVEGNLKRNGKVHFVYK